MRELDRPTTSNATTACPAPLRLEITSDTAVVAGVRRKLEAYAGQLGLSPEASGEIGLVVNEVLANVIFHAYGGAPGRPIVVTAECVTTGSGSDRQDPHPTASGSPATAAASNVPASDGNCDAAAMKVTIRDWGNGVNPDSLPPRERNPERPGGVGLICLRGLMDSVTFSPQPDGMLLTVIKKRANDAKR